MQIMPKGRLVALPCFCFDFSPDGKTLAQADGDGVIHVWDILSGRALAAFKGHTMPVKALAFAPDGKTVASGSEDTTVLIWDVSKLARPAAPAKALQAADLSTLWQTLAQDDAEKAVAAMADLAAAPRDAVAWIRERVKPVARQDMKRTAELIQQLDSQQFKLREAAKAELLDAGDQIVPALDKALTANLLQLESKQRLEDLRGKLTGMILQGDRLRAYRAIEVLELIGTPEARQVLQTLADGASGALITASAQAALKRLGR
jgi:WD40 repeat protein